MPFSAGFFLFERVSTSNVTTMLDNFTALPFCTCSGQTHGKILIRPALRHVPCDTRVLLCQDRLGTNRKTAQRLE